MANIGGTSCNDTLTGGIYSDSVIAHEGDDVISTGNGDDTVYAGSGNDTVYGGAGNDYLLGEAGNDALSGGTGNDRLFGGDGDDYFNVGAGSDSVYAGAGNDTIHMDALDSGLNYIYGGEGWDLLDAVGLNFYQINDIDGIEEIHGSDYGDYWYWGSEAMVFVAGCGADTLLGGSGNDSIYAGAGNDSVTGGDGNDSISGLSGDDKIFGGTGNDTLYGGEGADSISGGAGADALIGGAGNDTLTGGSDADIFVMLGGGGTDRVTDFDLTLIDGKTLDQFDVSDLRNPDGSKIRWRDVCVSDDGWGNAMLTFPEGEKVVLQGISPSRIDSKYEMATMGIPCFASGTWISTVHGDRLVEELQPGDLLWTLDHGAQPVLWHGERFLNAAELAAHPELRPIVFAAGALGNHRSLTLSPQHAILMQQNGAQVLVRARHLLAARGYACRIAHGRRQIRYHHVILPQHGIIFANGTAAETFYPGPMAIKSLDSCARASLSQVMPKLAPVLLGNDSTERFYGPTARPVLARRSVVAKTLSLPKVNGALHFSAE